LTSYKGKEKNSAFKVNKFAKKKAHSKWEKRREKGMSLTLRFFSRKKGRGEKNKKRQKGNSVFKKGRGGEPVQILNRSRGKEGVASLRGQKKKVRLKNVGS